MEKELYVLEEKPIFSEDIQKHKEAGQKKIIKKNVKFLAIKICGFKKTFLYLQTQKGNKEVLLKSMPP